MTNLSDIESNNSLKSDKFKKSKDIFSDKQFIENSTNNQNSVRKMNVNTIEDMRKRVDYIKKDLKPL